VPRDRARSLAGELPRVWHDPLKALTATAEFPPYLVLLRVGFALPAALLPRRCALTAPFHPYPTHSRKSRRIHVLSPEWAGRYVFCGTFRPSGFNLTSRTLSGTLLYGVRTFLPAHSRDPGNSSQRSSTCCLGKCGIASMDGAAVRSGCLPIDYS